LIASVCKLTEKDGFYFTIIETNLADYCQIELTRYWPNATLKIDYKDGTNQTIINLIGNSKDDVGCLIENDLNINETMNDSSNLIKSKYDFYDSVESSNTQSIQTSFITTTSKNTKYEESTTSNEDVTFDASTTGTHETTKMLSIEETSSLKYEESTNLNEDVNSDAWSSSLISTESYQTTENITIPSIEEKSTFINEVDQSTSIFVSTAENSLNYKVKSFYFTGILFQNIKFDDQYWLNGFRFESLGNGTIKIRVS